MPFHESRRFIFTVVPARVNSVTKGSSSLARAENESQFTVLIEMKSKIDTSTTAIFMPNRADFKRRDAEQTGDNYVNRSYS